MSPLRRLWPAFVLASLAFALAVGVPRAAATDPAPDTGIAWLDSQHFRVYYNRDDVNYKKAYITQGQAGNVLGMAERAYSLYSGWGLVTPPAQALQPDGKVLIPISVDDFCQPAISYADDVIRGPGPTPVVPDPAPFIDPSIPGPDQQGNWCRWSALMNPAPVSPDGEIHLDATTGLDYHTIAHKVFELFEWQADTKLWDDTSTGVDNSKAHWIQEGAAEWAAFRAEDFLTATKDNLGQSPDRAADCVGTECGGSDFDRAGYPGWLLFEYLTERFGSNIEDPTPVDAVVNGLQAATIGANSISSFLSSHSTTLESFFNDFTTERLTATFTPSTIRGFLSPTQATIATGLVAGSLPAAYVAVNHLGVGYVALEHGDPTNVRAPCYAATLALTVTIPNDNSGSPIRSTPYYYANTSGSTAQALSVSGATASITVPWNTCSGSPDSYLSLPNDTWCDPGNAPAVGCPPAPAAMDGREFKISGTLTVDLASPASPASPQPGNVVVGPVIAAPAVDPPPVLTIYAPELLRVNSRTRILRFIIFSSGSGSVDAVIGSTDLGKASLRAGDNDVRWRLPLSLVTALRKTSGNNVLALMSLSPSGTTGATYTRRVVIFTPRRR